MERTLDTRAFSNKEDTTKWVNQFSNLTDLVSIVYDSINNEFVVFFYWKK